MTDEHVRNQVVKSVQRAYSMEMNKHVPNGQRRSVNIHKIADTVIDAYESALVAAGYAVVPVETTHQMKVAGAFEQRNKRAKFNDE